jgi:accessory gene regulator B
MTLISTLLIFIFAEKNIPEAAMFYNSLIMLMFSNILIIMLSPVEHPNKPLNDELRKKLRNKSVLWAGIWTVFCIVFIIIDISICFYAASGVFTIALAMIAEKFKLKEKVR